jgi:hypothetical protein
VAREGFDEREQLVFAHKIDFGKDKEDRAVEPSNEAEEEFIFALRRATFVVFSHEAGFCFAAGWLLELYAASSVDQDENQVTGLKRFVNLLQHTPIKLRASLVNAGSIDKNDLRRRMLPLASRHFHDAGDAVARCLRLGRDNGHLFPDEGIQQGALAHVGASDDGDESGFQS